MKDYVNFIESWTADEYGVKPLFVALKNFLQGLPQVELAFKGRPGISYSLRAKHSQQTDRDLFVLIDVIDDEPDARWLSICFYADLITDDKGVGDTVPGGLMGADAHCFDVESADLQPYLLEKLQEAYVKATK